MNEQEAANYQSTTTLNYRGGRRGRLHPELPGLAAFDRDSRNDLALAIGLYVNAYVSGETERAEELYEPIEEHLKQQGLALSDVTGIFGDIEDEANQVVITDRIQAFIGIGKDGNTISLGDRVRIENHALVTNGQIATVSRKQLPSSIGWVTVSVEANPNNKHFPHGGLCYYPSTVLVRQEVELASAAPDWAAAPQVVVITPPPETEVIEPPVSQTVPFEEELEELEYGIPGEVEEPVTDYSADSEIEDSFHNDRVEDDLETEDFNEPTELAFESEVTPSPAEHIITSDDVDSVFGVLDKDIPVVQGNRPTFDFSSYREEQEPLYVAEHAENDSISEDDDDNDDVLPSWMSD